MNTQHKMQDPRKQYPVMDIPPQTQPEPGLDAELRPQADHGYESYVGSGRLSGRKALITGGDSGIGRAVAVAYAREGAAVALSYLPSEQADVEEVADIITRDGGTVVLLPGDLTDESYARGLPAKAVEALGGLDIVVNNAGKQVFNDDITTLSTQQLVDTFTVNVYAMVWVIQEALKYLQPGAHRLSIQPQSRRPCHLRG